MAKQINNKKTYLQLKRDGWHSPTIRKIGGNNEFILIRKDKTIIINMAIYEMFIDDK